MMSKGAVQETSFEAMSHEQVMESIVEGLHYLTTTDLVKLHKEISEVQIKRSHLQEEILWQKDQHTD